ncbi:MAG: ABC transporter ATP-binding protein [Chloroflexi bacterium]|nr:ABC transporter ATP-binding protein [Chloroflexota bacterium]
MAHEGKLLEIRSLKTYFFFDEGIVRAVDGVSLSLEEGQTLGIVGESGCGKSVTAQSILQIVGAGGRIVDGEILFRRNTEVVDLVRFKSTSEEIRQIRGRDIAMIFQEPMTAFSPVYAVGKQIAEAILVHTDATPREARERAIELLGKVGIPQPRRRVDAYPFELSGGMRQRAMIAMALACDPTILIADEPTTALDVTIQAQILDLLKSIQQEMGMAIMIITHNMGVIAEMADIVAVMYLGKVIESAPVWELFDHPRHPYTIALLKSIPMVEEEVKQRLESIKGTVPDPYNLPGGCRFHPRCGAYRPGTCDASEPPRVEVSPGHVVSCFLVGGDDGR